MLYQGACLDFVAAVLSPNFFLLPLFWEGPAVNQFPSFLLEAGSCCAQPCSEIVPWYEYNGSSSCHLLRGVVPIQGQARRYSLHLPLPTAVSKHRRSHRSPSSRLLLSLLKGLPLESGAGPAKSGVELSSVPFVPGQMIPADPAWKRKYSLRGNHLKLSVPERKSSRRFSLTLWPWAWSLLSSHLSFHIVKRCEWTRFLYFLPMDQCFGNLMKPMCFLLK